MHKTRWGDLQYVLAIANSGSVAAAARELQVNHSTVLRRLDAFEFRHKVTIFKRRASKYTLTVQGVQLLNSAQDIDKNIQKIERLFASYGLKLEGWLQVTTTDVIFRYLLSPHLLSFQRTYDKIKLNLSLTPKPADLASMESEVAIRPGFGQPQDLGSEALCEIQIGCYASPDYLANISKPLQQNEVDWLLPSMLNTQLPIWEKLMGQFSKEQIKLSADSFEALKLCAEQAMGVALLPYFVGDSSNTLQRLDLPLELPTLKLWVVVHPDLLKSSKVNMLIRHLRESFKT